MTERRAIKPLPRRASNAATVIAIGNESNGFCAIRCNPLFVKQVARGCYLAAEINNQPVIVSIINEHGELVQFSRTSAASMSLLKMIA